MLRLTEFSSHIRNREKAARVQGRLPLGRLVAAVWGG